MGRAENRRKQHMLGKRGDLNRKSHHKAQTHAGMNKEPLHNKFLDVKASKKVESFCKESK